MKELAVKIYADVLRYLAHVMNDMTAKDAVDILIIAFFLYLVIVWFKKSRVRLILMGMTLMGIIYALADTFRLYLTTMAFQAFFAVALIMLVVIFQDDLRHFFERVALAGIIGKRRSPTSHGEMIEMLASALANLSRKKIGALVILRGHDPLDRHLEAGIAIDGVLSQVLLETLFDPHVPSHDGAVIIEGGRVTRFGCYLPLSTNIAEVGRLGTRHAAGLGLAERADALSLVVSEEYGTISVAEEGHIRQLNGIAEVHTVLGSFYQARFPDTNRMTLYNILIRHLPAKIGALILALGLWAAFGHQTATVRRDFIVPVEYRNLAPTVIVREASDKEATVTIDGLEQTFNLLKPSELRIPLDMASVKDGTTEFAITKEMIRVPSGLSVVGIRPEKVWLTTYRMVPVSIPIKVATKGKVAGGYAVKDIKIDPRLLEASAPSTVRSETITAVTEPIDLKPLTETTTITPRIIITPESVKVPDAKMPDVKVTVEIEAKEKK